jgi:cbb3-type cytochrome oxidase maturation protein
MNEATIAQTALTLLILVIFIGLLVWGIKSRQFHNVEDAKYRMLENEDAEDNKETLEDNRQEKQP